jgi:hypothetical protein
MKQFMLMWVMLSGLLIMSFGVSPLNSPWQINPSVALAKNAKVQICHVPPGNPTNAQTLTISENAIASHLENHELDFLGPCPPSCAEVECDDGDACTLDA